MQASKLASFAVHLITASGGGLALLALLAVSRADWQMVFLLLGAALIVDGIDGPLARRARVGDHIAWLDGAKLDVVVDYTTYVLVPALVIAEAGLVPSAWAVPAAVLIAITGALYLADDRMKTPEAAFRGFPAVWNTVAFMLFILPLPAAINLALVLALALLTFAPIEFVHPLRVRRLRPLTLAMTVLWGLLALAAIVGDLTLTPVLTWVFALVCGYFALIGAALQLARHLGRGPAGQR
ncbi:MAG: CDP-alcohol phosphatidyltransferase family protein [Alphaproteobacteria bacterium]